MIAKTTVWQILTDNNIDSSPNRSEVTWTEFSHSQAAVACDLFTVDTATLRRYYVLFFIKVDTREMFCAGVAANPTGAWTTIVVDYVARYNQHRPHQSLGQQPPTPVHDPPDAAPATVIVLRTRRCDGLIHDRNAA